jgi:hypothetical protein
MDPADLLILSVVACLDGIVLICLRRRHRRVERAKRMSRLVRRGLLQLARA